MAGEAHTAQAAHAAGEGAHAAAFPPFDASLFASQLVWFALTFAVLYFLMANVALPGVQKVLDKRAAALKSDLDSAARESAAAEAARADMERTAAEARAQSRKLIDDMRAEAQAELAAEQAKAEKGLTEQSAAAETRIQEMRRTALSQVGAMADDLAKDIVARLAPTAQA
ncbi:MAG: ATP F0F1 synthase subunit B [Hyphomonadaceae bacterium]